MQLAAAYSTHYRVQSEKRGIIQRAIQVQFTAVYWYTIQICNLQSLDIRDVEGRLENDRISPTAIGYRRGAMTP
jgi:hypothetical protein